MDPSHGSQHNIPYNEVTCCGSNQCCYCELKLVNWNKAEIKYNFNIR